MEVTPERQIEIIEELLKEGLIKQQTRIEIYPMTLIGEDNLKKIKEKYDLKDEQEVWDLVKSEHFRSEVETTHKGRFGFFNFERPFHELEFIFSEGTIAEINDEMEQALRERMGMASVALDDILNKLRVHYFDIKENVEHETLANTTDEIIKLLEELTKKNDKSSGSTEED